MPTYEYACPKCGRHFDLFQSMRDNPIRKCPKCGKLGVKRLVGGGAGLIFKGTGFYITDYKQKRGTPDAAEAKSTAGSGESAVAKSEAGAKTGPAAPKVDSAGTKSAGAAGASATGPGESRKTRAKGSD
jgi:putative FmdB family regulatory protein